MGLADKIRKKAYDVGFDAAAFLPARRVENDAYYEFWMSEGRQGEMRWMSNYPELRVDPSVLEPGSRTVIALLKNYNPGTDTLDSGLRIARYAQGDDYHDYLRDQMREIASFIHAETGAEVGARPAVDSAPLLERDVSRLAGLGWIGKNTMLINPEIGSFTFLAELLVAIDIEAPVEPRVPDRCGTCSACIDACPTGAIVSPYLLDARRCISYLTIELRGPIPRELRPLIGDLLFGCDICQAVCPWNSKSPITEDERLTTRKEYHDLSPLDLLFMTQKEFSSTFRKSPLKRTKRRGLLRNAAVVLGNQARARDASSLTERLRDEPEPLVRGHVAWALGQIDTDESRAALEASLGLEEEAYVREEIEYALEHADG